jgi:predicted RNA-binding Zn-ribbon protein involved in translation (DUF1610 family)
MSTVYLNAGSESCSCDNCSWQGPATALDAINDIQERIDPGSEVPAGQCPDCGALAYLDSRALELDAASRRTTAARAMLAALKAIRDDLNTFNLWEWHTDDHPHHICDQDGGLGGACSLITTAIAQAEAAGITGEES